MSLRCGDGPGSPLASTPKMMAPGLLRLRALATAPRQLRRHVRKDSALACHHLALSASASAEFDETCEESFEEEKESSCSSADSHYMALALEQARLGMERGEVPIGAVLVDDATGEVLASAHNETETASDPTAHAEMLCLRRAAAAAGRSGAWRAVGTASLFVTAEPCPMCAGAIMQSRIPRVVYGCRNDRLGADGSYVSLFPPWRGGDGGVDESRAPPHPFHPNVDIERGVSHDECQELLKLFFRRRRVENARAKEQQRQEEDDV